MTDIARKNNRVLASLAAVVVVMAGVAYAAVPLYDLFCRVTGYAGTTNVASERSAVTTDRVMKVRFDSMVNGIDWAFQPVRRQIEIRVGENALAFYRATNRSKQPVTGTAVFNVTPLKVGAYFSKTECFCFTEQRLAPGETMDMPVAFFVDPAIEQDPNLADVKTITLSYTFYPASEGDSARDQERKVSAILPPAEGAAGLVR